MNYITKLVTATVLSVAVYASANVVVAPAAQTLGPDATTSTAVFPKPLTISEKIDVVAKKYEVNAQLMRATISCESGFNESAYNGSDPYGGAHGIAQFLKPTFYRYASQLKIESPDIWNTDQQLELMAYMFSIGEAKQWTCWHIVKNTH